ncbi:MAG: hypothetical protein M3O50_11380 [Myxococcota bacterium]|nr:hypothetical protein [Myxococcota bacterium]
MRTAVARSEVAGPGTTEAAERPPPGLARGQWEAPTSSFVAVLILAVLLGVLAVSAWIIAPLRRRYRRQLQRGRR